MITQAVGKVQSVTDWDGDAQELTVRLELETRRAVNYPALTGPAGVGDEVLLNTTAQALKLGTGGYDFVSANLTHALPKPPEAETGHIIKGRYLPCQQAILTLEEQERYADVWERKLEGFPVLVGQLHSQIGPAAAGLHLSGRRRVAYVMTDAGALPMAFSRLVRDLKAAGLLGATLTCGQAFGGDAETVTLHSALLGAKHILHCDDAIVCQGPGGRGRGPSTASAASSRRKTWTSCAPWAGPPSPSSACPRRTSASATRASATTRGRPWIWPTPGALSRSPWGPMRRLCRPATASCSSRAHRPPSTSSPRAASPSPAWVGRPPRTPLSSWPPPPPGLWRRIRPPGPQSWGAVRK